MFFSFYSIFCLGSTKNEVHICNLHAKTQLLMYDKGGLSTKKFQLQKGDGGQSGSQDQGMPFGLPNNHKIFVFGVIWGV